MSHSLAESLDRLRTEHGLSVAETCRRRGVARRTWYDMQASRDLGEATATAWAEAIVGGPVSLRAAWEAPAGADA